MLGEVVADQGVEELGVAAQVRVGEADELTVAGSWWRPRPPGPGARRGPG